MPPSRRTLARASRIHAALGESPAKLQSEISLDRRVDFAWAADEDIPAAVGELAATDMGRAFSLKGFVHLPEPMHVDDVIAAEGGIGDQFAFPMAVGFLKTEGDWLENGECPPREKSAVQERKEPELRTEGLWRQQRSSCAISAKLPDSR